MTLWFGGVSRSLLTSGFGAAALLCSTSASAAVYNYVDWTAADVASGTASGTITLPDASTVSVHFAAINADSSPGTLYGAQTDGGTNYWSPSTPFISAQVDNAPPTPDILQLSGGLNQTYRVTLSEPIKDPIMAIVSLGQPSLGCTYDFDSPFTIVSQGVGYWGGSATALTALPDDVLEGYEGHGTIQFIGTFSTFSWTVPTPETWHGFTFAIRTTERIEPTPSVGGAAGAGGADGNAAGEGGSPGVGGIATVGGAASDGGAIGESGVAGLDPGLAMGGNGVAMQDPDSNQGGDHGVNAGAAQGGAADRVAVKSDAGCNCALAPGAFGVPGSAAGLLLLAAFARRRRKPAASRS